MDRFNFYYRQKVTEAELDAALSAAERADWNLAADIGVTGVISGGTVVQHDPVPNKTVDITGPLKSYDRTGRRVFIGAGVPLDLSVDEDGVSTDVDVFGNERWLSVFVAFDRSLSDPRTDGAGQQIQFQQNESYRFVVRQGAEAATGMATPVPLDDDLLLLADVRRHQDIGDPAPDPNIILDGDINTDRREAFVVFNAGQISAETGLFVRLAGGDVQAVLAAADAAFDAAILRMDDHVNGVAEKHPAADVTLDATSYTFIGQGGAGGVVVPAHVRQALELQEASHGAHVLDTDPALRHTAASVDAVDPGVGIGDDLNVGDTVQAQLDGIRNRLAETNTGEAGTWKIGSQDLIFGTYLSVAAGNLAIQLSSIANAVENTHTTYLRSVINTDGSTLNNGVARMENLGVLCDLVSVHVRDDDDYGGDVSLLRWQHFIDDGVSKVYIYNNTGGSREYTVRGFKIG